MNLAKIVRSIVAVTVLEFAVGCDATEGGAQEGRNAATREAQQALVADMKPLEPRKRLRRVLRTSQTPQEAGLPLAQDADVRETEAGKQWLVAAAEIERNLGTADLPKTASDDVERVIFVDGENEWELEYGRKELEAIFAEAQRRGINDASDGDFDDEDPNQHDRGWSNGIDSRVRKPINATYPRNHRVLGRLAELNGGGCSGQMVGRRLVLTAAHCVVPASGAQVSHTVRVRRSGNSEPYGEVTTSSYWWSHHWTANNCHTNRRFDPCSQHDWALLRLPDDAWDDSPNGTPGWMGYWVPGQNYIRDNAVNNNDGYPACGFDGAPDGCNANPNQVWGQTFAGTARGFLWPHDNVPAYYRLSVDMSGGHSGSANWTDYPGQNGPYTLGIAMWSHCFEEECADLGGDWSTHPSGFRGMTPYLAGFISDKRVAHP
jgi:V8-like Glu-specific endopeptidase